jgi:hypothetical protein
MRFSRRRYARSSTSSRPHRRGLMWLLSDVGDASDVPPGLASKRKNMPTAIVPWACRGIHRKPSQGGSLADSRKSAVKAGLILQAFDGIAGVHVLRRVVLLKVTVQRVVQFCSLDTNRLVNCCLPATRGTLGTFMEQLIQRFTLRVSPGGYCQSTVRRSVIAGRVTVAGAGDMRGGALTKLAKQPATRSSKRHCPRCCRPMPPRSENFCPTAGRRRTPSIYSLPESKNPAKLPNTAASTVPLDAYSHKREGTLTIGYEYQRVARRPAIHNRNFIGNSKHLHRNDKSYVVGSFCDRSALCSIQ